VLSCLAMLVFASKKLLHFSHFKLLLRKNEKSTSLPSF
jgi:hypothetical protein